MSSPAIDTSPAVPGEQNAAPTPASSPQPSPIAASNQPAVTSSAFVPTSDFLGDSPSPAEPEAAAPSPSVAPQPPTVQVQNSGSQPVPVVQKAESNQPTTVNSHQADNQPVNLGAASNARSTASGGTVTNNAQTTTPRQQISQTTSRFVTAGDSNSANGALDQTSSELTAVPQVSGSPSNSNSGSTPKSNSTSVGNVSPNGEVASNPVVPGTDSNSALIEEPSSSPASLARNLSLIVLGCLSAFFLAWLIYRKFGRSKTYKVHSKQEKGKRRNAFSFQSSVEVEKGAIDTDFTGRPRSTDYMIVDHVWVHKGAHKSIDPAASGPPELVINDEAISVEAINRIIGPLKRTSIDNATHSDVSIDSRTLDVIEKLVIGEQHTNGRHSWRISSSRSHHSESAEIGSVSPIETHFIIPSADVNFCISRVVVQDYDPQKEDELSLRRGDSLTILKSFVDGWFWARNDNGQEGMIPGNFLE